MYTNYESLYRSDDIQILKETTQWDYPNHVYFVNRSDKMVAYRPNGGELQIFTKPLSFFRSRRNFMTLKDFSSTKSKYKTTTNSCTCKGFLYRKKCRHITELMENSYGQKAA